MNKIIYKELIAFHPGYYIKDLIDELGMTQDELAKRLGSSGKNISDLINGKCNLSDEMALKLSIVFGTTIDMWLNLNKTFISKKLEIEKRILEDEQCELIKYIDYNFGVNLKLVKQARKSTEKVRELQKYFKVSSLDVLKRHDFLVQCRTAVAQIQDINVINANAWIQTAINIGNNIDVDDFNIKKLKSILPDIRKMTTQSPDIFYPELKSKLASCGVALVLLPNLKNCGVNGAVKWISKEKVILAINDRRKYADTFWFSLFHELGHVLQQRVKILIISEENDILEQDELMQRLEEDADSFSQNMLIPESNYNEFVKQHTQFSKYDIVNFAKSIDIHPGIVLGRLQKENYISYKTTLNSLKTKYHVVQL
ncbi:MAG: HigA family addiction module antidote protein [Lachnospiraceae bacterium]|nr:HigA family addiction module antidote protein [Lachnospiraceae bacterium]